MKSPIHHSRRAVATNLHRQSRPRRHHGGPPPADAAPRKSPSARVGKACCRQHCLGFARQLSSTAALEVGVAVGAEIVTRPVARGGGPKHFSFPDNYKCHFL
jgi:hypothetical protein